MDKIDKKTNVVVTLNKDEFKWIYKGLAMYRESLEDQQTLLKSNVTFLMADMLSIAGQKEWKEIN